MIDPETQGKIRKTPWFRPILTHFFGGPVDALNGTKSSLAFALAEGAGRPRRGRGSARVENARVRYHFFYERHVEFLYFLACRGARRNFR